MATTKISIAVDKKKLRLARAAAKSAGLSLSALFSRGLDLQLEIHERRKAASELVAGWGPESLPTDAQRDELRRHMQRPRKQRFRAA